jgi:peptidase E
VGAILRELHVKGPVGVVAAGWQERETDPGIVPDLPVKSVNLTLHARAEDVFAKDKDFSAAYKERQTRLRLMQDFYRVRLDHANEAARVISLRMVDKALLEEERKASLEVIRNLDSDHLERCRAQHEAFEKKWPSVERDSIGAHKKELKKLIAPTDAIVIAGGHVAVLLNRLQLFGFEELIGGRTIIAWSAGAMALCELVVLFHDDPPHGERRAEVLDRGLNLIPGLIVLPNPRLRLRLDDEPRIAAFSQRFSPMSCIAMDHGARITAEDGRVTSTRVTQKLLSNGTIEWGWA